MQFKTNLVNQSILTIIKKNSLNRMDHTEDEIHIAIIHSAAQFM